MTRKTLRSSAILLVASLCYGCGTTAKVTANKPPPNGLIYLIDGAEVRLDESMRDGGYGSISLLGSVTGDVSGDGRDDVAVLLIWNSEGSGVFYYLNVLVDDGTGRLMNVGEEFLGDRIQLDFMDIYHQGSVSALTGVPIHPDDYGQLVVAYRAHADGQSFAERPGMFVTRHWKADQGSLHLIEDY